ncbi:MAG: sugar-binding protein [Thermoanaerobaculia bacterium]
MRHLHLFAAVLLLAAPALADPSPTPAGEIVVNGKKKLHYRIPRMDAAPRIDGVLDEPSWEQGLVLEIETEIDPGKNVPAPVSAFAFLAYDDDNLYVAFRAHDPEPSAIRAHLSDRDTPYADDFVGIMLDTFNDERGGYEFFVNPLGVQMDLARNETSSENEEDANWDAIWSSAGRIDEQGYTVEMAIPFSSLRFQRSAGEQTWGLTAFRSYPRSRRHQINVNAVDPDDSCFICHIPKVTGFAGATPGRNVEFDPTLTAHRTDRREAFPEGSYAGEEEADLGLTARWGITPNLTFSGAVNPDFSQVEADAAPLDVNTQFTLFFPEKRPFFLEGADFFETPWNVIHTRTVADPAWGVKLTGKEGRNGIGLFVAQDEVTNLLLPGSQRSATAALQMETTDAALRYRRDFGARPTWAASSPTARGRGTTTASMASTASGGRPGATGWSSRCCNRRPSTRSPSPAI